MNHYGKIAGCHTPENTQRLMEMLTEEGITVTDESWHNDEIDRLHVPLNDEFYLTIWVGDPSHPEDYCNVTSIVKTHKESYDHDADLFASNNFRAIVEKIVELTAN